jgi:hypothetical protein
LLNRQELTPLIIYSAKDFTGRELTHIKQSARNVIIKDVKSLDLLLEEMTMHLHINHKVCRPSSAS